MRSVAIGYTVPVPPSALFPLHRPAVMHSSFCERLGRCYELSGRYVTCLDATLVHGTIEGLGHGPIGHGWVELRSGDEWEPITDAVYAPDRFEAIFNPAIEIRYPSREARRIMLSSKHFGPWHLDTT